METFDIIWKVILFYASSMGFTTAYHYYQESIAAKNWKDFMIMTSPYAWFNMKKYKQKQNVSNNRTNKTD